MAARTAATRTPTPPAAPTAAAAAAITAAATSAPPRAPTARATAATRPAPPHHLTRTDREKRGRTPFSVAAARARVGERLPGLGREAPVEAARVQRDLEDAEGLVVAHLAAGDGCRRAGVIVAARADDDLLQAARLVERARRVQRREALVEVLVTDEHEVGVGV